MSNEFIGEGTPLEDIPVSSSSQMQEDSLPDNFGDIKSYQKGDIIQGRVVQVKDDMVLLDIQTKTEGVLPRDEISYAPNPSTTGFLKGEEVEVMVINEGEDIYTLSKKLVDEKKKWDRVEKAHNENSRMQGKIIAAVNGGLIVDIGGRAFLPQSQIDLRKIDDLDPMIGQDIEIKVLEYDKEKNRLVVSRRLCIEEDLEKEKLDAFNSIKKGLVLDGKVEKIVDYGVFVNLGNGITGLLHVSELSWERVEDPGSIFKIGDPIQVKVLKIDKDKKKISLSRKATLPEPWDVVTDKYKKDDIVEGTVTRVTSFGCFVRLDDYFEGLAHVSELVDQRISHAKEVFQPGDRVTVLVLEVDKSKKRIRLSIKRAREQQTEREIQGFLKHQQELDNTLGSRFGNALSDLSIASESAVVEEKDETSDTLETVVESTAAIESTSSVEAPSEETEQVKMDASPVTDIVEETQSTGEEKTEDSTQSE